jgi:hypothetical protein
MSIILGCGWVKTVVTQPALVWQKLPRGVHLDRRQEWIERGGRAFFLAFVATNGHHTASNDDAKPTDLKQMTDDRLWVTPGGVARAIIGRAMPPNNQSSIILHQ